MAKPDRAARVAGRFVRNQARGEWGDEVEAKDATALARLIRREVKRAVEEDREACRQLATSAGAHALAAAIRARK